MYDKLNEKGPNYGASLEILSFYILYRKTLAAAAGSAGIWVIEIKTFAV